MDDGLKGMDVMGKRSPDTKSSATTSTLECSHNTQTPFYGSAHQTPRLQNQ